MGPFLVKSCVLSEAVIRSCSIKKRVLNNFTEKQLCRGLFLIKLQPEDLKLY